MLYVFHVDTGTMLTFDMNLAMESVSMLQAMIEKMCRIPKDKQVLLISGGENLSPNSRVCSYSAGTDTSPIYLFSKSSIEAATPPNASVNYGSETDLRDQVEGSLNMPPSYETVVARAQLALQFHDVAKEELRMCEHLVHDQHLQHQGWAAVIANLEDITSAFWSRIDVFKKNVHSYLSSRENYLEILASFSEAIQLLGKIPVLPCLLSRVPRELEECKGEESVTTSSKTLLNWISAQDSRSSLEQMAQQCLSSLHQFDEKVKESLLTEAQTLLDAINNPSMKEVKGLEDRLYGLEQLMFGAKKIVQEQGEMAQGFVQNENRARNLADASVLPDLCNSHRHQLVVLLKNHQSLHDIRRRCMLAKEELSINLHTRLRWVMYIEKSICDIDGKLVIHHETLKKLKRRLEIIQQTYDAPVVYARAVHEVVRRRLFATQFLEWANNLAGESSHMHHKEIVKRKQFAAYMKHHFLQALFPGFEDSPPPFAVKSPEPFDVHLPAIQREDLDYLRHEVPQLAPHLQLDEDIDLRRLLLGMTKHTVDVAVPCDGTQTDELTTSEIIILQPEGDTDEGVPENPFYNSRMQALPLLSLAGQLREHVAKGNEPVARGDDPVAKDDNIDGIPPDAVGIQPPSDEHNYDLSQSVEVLETDVSTEDDTTTQQVSQKTGDTIQSLEDDIQLTHKVDTTSSPMPERKHLDSGHSGTSAEFEECSSGAFMTADFFIDESLPSSMAESAATKKVVELQMALQEKVLSLETKERELEEQRQLVDCLKPKLANMQENFTTLKGMVENGTHGLRCDIHDMQKDVQAEKDEFRMFVERATHQLMTAIADFEAEKERQRTELMEEVKNQHTQEKCQLEAQLTVANEKVENTQQEMESTERKLKEAVDECERVRQTTEVRITALKDEFAAELQQVKSALMLEHEVELEKTVNDMRLELEERDRQMEEAQSLSETRLAENTALVAQHDQIAESLQAAFEKEKAEILRSNEVSLAQQLAEAERTLQESLKETHCREIETLRGENDEALKNANTETSKELTALHETAMVALRAQLSEEQAETLAQVTEELKVEKEKQLNELRDSLTESHRVELHDLEQRLQLSHQEALTKCLDGAAEAHQVELNERAEEHERTVSKLRDELGSEHESEMLKVKEQFQSEKQKLLQLQQQLQKQQHQLEQQQQGEQEDQQPPADGEKTESVGARDMGDDGDAACMKAAFEEEMRKAVEEAVETEKQRHETELKEHALRLEKDMAALKASLVAEKQVKFNEALNKVVAEKNEVIERLKERELELLREKERDEATISQLRSSGSRSDRPADVSEARLIQQTLEAELASARQGRLQVESELRHMRHSSQAAALSQSVFTPPVMAESIVPVPSGASMTQSVMAEHGSLEDRVCELRKCLQSKDLQLVSLQHRVMELSMTTSSRTFVQDKVSITTCNPGDLVLLCLDEQHDHYVVFTVGTTLHFLHSDCLDALALRTGPGEPRKSWVLAEIVDKEYCQAKKAQNRFKVPVGTKFYRVRAVPWKNKQAVPPTTSQTTSQQKEQQKGT